MRHRNRHIRVFLQGEGGQEGKGEKVRGVSKRGGEKNL